jgi:hypothetical protein
VFSSTSTLRSSPSSAFLVERPRVRFYALSLMGFFDRDRESSNDGNEGRMPGNARQLQCEKALDQFRGCGWRVGQPIPEGALAALSALEQ